MTPSNTVPICQCNGSFKTIDAHGYSKTIRCATCRRCALVIDHPRFSMLIHLTDFHFKRGNGVNQRPLHDLGMARQLVACLQRDECPSLATAIDYGIDSELHLGGLQQVVREGLSAYELDRVMGDGRAITQLVRGLPYLPYTEIEYRTAYDAPWLEEHFE